MSQLSLTTESDSQIEYVRNVPDGQARLTLDYTVPVMSAYRCSEGWKKTLEECAGHELEAHHGLIEEARAEIIEALACNDDPQHQPLVLKVDNIIQRLAKRTCRFVGEKFLEIEAGFFRDEWMVLDIPTNVSDLTVTSMILGKMAGTRRDLVERVYLKFGLEAEMHEARN